MKRKALRIFGGLLFTFALVSAYVWFYLLAPVRHLSSYTWMHEHTPQQQWIELQKELYRHAYYLHESGTYLGIWGDEKWASWLISEFQAGREHDWCRDGHLGSALPFITNQEPGNDSTNAWIAWWTTNSNKSQEEWIRDGFAQRGILVSRNLTTNTIIELLKLQDLHYSAESKYASTNKIPRNLRYNAFRWLRDAGVSPQSIDLASVPEAERLAVAYGLIRYAGSLGAYSENPGRIFHKEEDYSAKDKWFMIPQVEVTFGILLALIAFVGLRLIFHRGKK